MKILIVDDCPTTRKLLGLYLTAGGFEVAYAENGLDALEKLGAECADLVIADLNMPYMDGIEFVKALRADAALSSIPVLMVTTERDPGEREQALQAGADGYLTKPVSAQSLTRHIRSMLKDICADERSTHA